VKRIRRACRGAGALFFFALFGAGGLLVSPLVCLLRTPRRAQPAVRALWRLFVAFLRATGIIGVDARLCATGLRGCVIAANHPTLLDVVIVTALCPRTLYVAKQSLLRNPFMAAIVRRTSMPVDENLPEAVAPYLREGWNVLVFPEGTRSPCAGGLQPFHRGVAQLVLRTGAPLVCLGIRLSKRILAKGQSPWEMGEKRVVYTLQTDAPTVDGAGDLSRPLRPQAVRLTDEIRRRIERLILSNSPESRGSCTYYGIKEVV
jgi:1-acyl-sn-glycerol-3-phosphate acyltransferase